MSNAPCPFCDGQVDPEGLRGPECENCGATAPNLGTWNTRIVNSQRPDLYIVLWYGSFLRNDAAGYTDSIREAGHFTKEKAEKFLSMEGVTIHLISEYVEGLHRELINLQREKYHIEQLLCSL